MTDKPLQRPLSRIHIKDLRLRTFIGFNDDEQRKRQDVVINIRIHYDALPAAKGDTVSEALDYKTITKQVIRYVEDNRFYLLEALVNDLLEMVMQHNPVEYAEVEIDKPHALRFSDSVSLAMSASKTP
ncbi:MAG: dihydroneopterin triphosphate 2'-epimerase [Spiribacter sp.]|nr:dihydroneopterin triphosphate 2'-epimerase [Spiribacter sp.]MDR9481081.1 dihydroneopterin triphosphate 2'-epimerase [Spiribacter sp.]